MPALVERGHIYIAQPPLYKVKAGKDERYLKDDAEEAQYMMQMALNDAELKPAEGAAPISGEALAELAPVQPANAIITRLSRAIDDALNAIMTGGVALKMDNIEQATATAEELKKAINDINIDVQARVDEQARRWRCISSSPPRQHQGTVIDADFVSGPTTSSCRRRPRPSRA
jgi:DNA gyrase subunit B